MRGELDTSTGRGLELVGGFVADAEGRDARFTRTDDGYVDDREPRADGLEGEVDLHVYCTVRVQVTLAEGYDPDELAAIAAGELSWGAELVSVDRVERDVHYRPTGALEAPARPAHGLFRRFRGV